MEGISYLIASVLFALCFAQLLAKWRAQLDIGLLLAAASATSLWAGINAYEALTNADAFRVAPIFDIFRYLAWFAFLYQLITSNNNNGARPHLRDGLIIRLSIVAIVLALSTAFFTPTPSSTQVVSNAGMFIGLAGYLILNLIGLVGLVQLFKSIAPNARSAYSYLILALVCLFSADLILYLYTLVTSQMQHWVWTARGFIFSIAGAFLFLAARNPKWSKIVSLSHEAMLYFAAFCGGVAFLFISLLALHFIQNNVGFWSGLAQFALLIGAGLLLSLVWFSERRRSQLKVFLNKHFFNYKYDYREEWHRFIRTLSPGGPGAHLLDTVIEALAQIVGSKAGALWLRSESGQFEFAANHGMHEIKNATQAGDSSLVQFLETWQWIINLDEYETEPDLYQELRMPLWLLTIPKAWLVVPLMQDIKLLGFMVISKPNIMRPINWEDHDLLKTAGRQAATHLAQLMTVQALIEAREFQAFNRLSAFVIHDLKNLIAQLSMLVANFPKFKHNAIFIEDAVSTVQNSVEKMNRLLAQLRKGNVISDATKPIDLTSLIKTVVDERRQFTPKPFIEHLTDGIFVVADLDRITSVLEHLIQNAQDATHDAGKVTVRLAQDGHCAIIEIADTGCGMDANFIRDRLFRPFDTTKGQGGMGIGAYESREHVREMGGEILVTSEPGHGTTFRITLPIFSNSVDGPKN